MAKAILDDIDQIRKIDKSNMLSACVEASKHYEKAAELAKAMPISYAKPKTIIVAGMGGSAIGGELLKDWARDKISIPIEICREYSLPAYVDKDCLVFVVSYSGETEETLSAFLDAVKRGCMTVCISSGGTLRGVAQKLDIPHLRIPSGMAPRAALPYLFTPMPILLRKIDLIPDIKDELSETIHVLQQTSDSNAPEEPLDGNVSKKLASEIYGTVPVVYGHGFYRAVAQRFKQEFNENSKVPAKWEYFSELNHNEIVGWEEAQQLAKDFSIILIRDKEESQEMRKRIEATKELICKDFLKILEVWSMGRSRLAKMLSTVCVGDFTSVYLAIMRRIDPTPVKTISLLKEKVSQSRVKEKVVGELEKLAVK